jgi:hypothetical protein
MKFPYRKYQVDPSASVPKGVLYRPMIPLRLIGAGGEKVVLALAGSGADETMFPRSLGNVLGVQFDEDASLPVGGIAGQTVDAVLGELIMEVTTGKRRYRWKQFVRFADFSRPEDEIAVLGHIGFLNYFTTTFNGQGRPVTLKPNKALLKRQTGTST